jgi:hypothetical protein
MAMAATMQSVAAVIHAIVYEPWACLMAPE